MKCDYECELKEWVTHENLSQIAVDLANCDDMETISYLWDSYNRQAIRLASKLIIGDKGSQVNEWVQQLDTA